MLSPAQLRAAATLVATLGSSACVPVFRHAEDSSSATDAAQDDVTLADVVGDRSSVEEDVVSVDVTSPADVGDARPDVSDVIVLPVRVTPSQICAGNGFTCAIVREQVFCWGRNQFFQTGNDSNGAESCNNTNTSACPVRVVDAIKDERALEVSCGAEFACARMSNGALYCWGRNERGQLGPNVSNTAQTATQVTSLDVATAITTGAAHACAVTTTGVYCWGDNARGQLGGATTSSTSRVPVLVSGIASANPVIALRAGATHTVAWTSGNELYGWGTSTHGQLSRDSSSALLMSLPAGPRIGAATTFAAGWALTCVATTINTLCAGSNAAGELGVGAVTVFGTSQPFDATRVAATGPLRLVAAGGRAFGGGTIRQHVCATSVSNARAVRCWGNNVDSQLGDIPASGAEVPAPSQQTFSFASDIVGLAAGASHTCALSLNHEVRCWGSNGFGEANGRPSSTAENTPIRTPSLVAFP